MIGKQGMIIAETLETVDRTRPDGALGCIPSRAQAWVVAWAEALTTVWAAEMIASVVDPLVWEAWVRLEEVLVVSVLHVPLESW